MSANDAAASDEFGSSVAIDGDTVVVGSPHPYVPRKLGSAYVFHTSDGGATYGLVAKLTASDAAAGDNFGISVAIYGDTIVVGAYAWNGDGWGSAYVFRTTDSGATYLEVAILTASDAAVGDNFGCSVAIAADTVVVGARFDDVNGNDSGSVYVFRTTDGGATYSQVAKLTADRALGHVAGDDFGDSVAIDGATVVVGVKDDDDGGRECGDASEDSVQPPRPLRVPAGGREARQHPRRDPNSRRRDTQAIRCAAQVLRNIPRGRQRGSPQGRGGRGLGLGRPSEAGRHGKIAKRKSYLRWRSALDGVLRWRRGQKSRRMSGQE
jgi:hypothetical protein